MNTSLIAPAVALLAGGGVFLFFFGVYTALVSVPSVEERLRRYGAEPSPNARRSRLQARGAPNLAVSQGLARSLGRSRRGALLARDLARADLQITASEFILIQILLTAFLGIVGLFLVKSPLLAIIFAVVGYFVPIIWLKIVRARRLRAFNNQLADTIGMLASSLRSGYSLPQAMDLLVRDGRPPISTEFFRVNREVGLGLHPTEALNNMLERVPSDDLDLMVTAINIQRDVGGNLAEVLDSIAETIRDRVKLAGEIRVLTAQQAISGYVISGLPVGLGVILYLVNPEYFGKMFTSICGWLMLGCAAAGIISGFFVMRKITDIKV